MGVPGGLNVSSQLSVVSLKILLLEHPDRPQQGKHNPDQKPGHTQQAFPEAPGF